MSLGMLQTTGDNLFTNLDPRVKMFFVFEMMVLLYLGNNIQEILVLSLLPVLIAIKLDGVKEIIQMIWSLKWYFLLFGIFGYILSNSIPINQIILIYSTFLTLLLSFRIFSRTTNPDQVTDALIKLKIPPSIAWRVGVTLRQVYFIYEEIAQIRKIQSKFRNKEVNNRLQRIEQIADVITSVYANSIRRAIYFSNTLENRDFNGAHKEIITITSKLTKKDIGYFILSLIPLILFSLIRSQVFI